MKKILNFFNKNWLFLIIIFQPILDIIAYFNYHPTITLITFIARSIILIFIVIYVFITIKNKKKYILMLLPICAFSCVHLLNSLRLGSYSLFSDLRYLIIVMQLPILIVAFCTYLKEYPENGKSVKKGIICSFLIIFTSLVASYVLGTYESTYSNSSGQYGITGWFTSANTQSMILTIVCPLFLYYFTKNESKIKYVLGHFLVFLVLYTNGTRACFYGMVSMFLVITFISITKKHSINKIFNIFISVIFLLSSLLSYNYSSTLTRRQDMSQVEENNQSSIEEIDNKYNEELKKIEQEILNNSQDDNEIKLTLQETKRKNLLDKLNSSYLYRELIEKYGEDVVLKKMEDKISSNSLSDNRLRKVINAQIIYDNTDFFTKLFGFDFSLISKDSMDMENDLTAIFYYYGYFGFTLYMSYLIYFIIIAIKSLIKSPRKLLDGEFIILCFVFALVVVGGEYSGAFLRKPNANIYLALSLSLLYANIKNDKKNKTKNLTNKIKFLLLHLGYGGIETATINSANALCDKYDIELVSFYNLKYNQENKINSRIKIKYLYDDGPNKEKFEIAVQKKQIFKILFEGIKALKILFLKKYLIAKEIKNSDVLAIVSTRMEFNILLSKYGNKNTIKIAQEHRHHNNDKKYINTIKNKYHNIDYLFALTDSLAEDYKLFLKNNNHTKIVVVPNMLINYPNKISKLEGSNIICVSRLHYDKRVNELIDIYLNLDKKGKFYIIGDGEEYNNLKNQIKLLKLQKNVKLLGYLNSNEIEKYMLNSDAFVMASISEGLPMALLEAMSYGLPCIAYETASGVKDIIDNGKNGYVIKNRNKEKFFKSLNAILANKEKARMMQKNALKKSNEFSEIQILKEWNKILGESK